MSLTDREGRIVLRLMSLLGQSRPPSRQEKKARGLKYCKYPGYGFKWSRGGRRVVDEHERAVMARIVAWREKGTSWYQIARALLLERVRTKAGQEWSERRCRRAYQAELLLRRTAARDHPPGGT